MIESEQSDIEKYSLDYVYELNRIIDALAITADAMDERTIKARRKLVEMHAIFSLKSDIIYFNESDKNYDNEFASKDNANCSYKKGDYLTYANEMITLEKYITEANLYFEKKSTVK